MFSKRKWLAWLPEKKSEPPKLKSLDATLYPSTTETPPVITFPPDIDTVPPETTLSPQDQKTQDLFKVFEDNNIADFGLTHNQFWLWIKNHFK